MLGHDQNPGRVPITILKVVEAPVRPQLTERERKIRQLFGLLAGAELSARGWARLAGLMEEFESELGQILSQESVCWCLKVPSRCSIREIRHFNGILSRTTPVPCDDEWEDLLVRNASGRGFRIGPRRLRH